MSPPQIHGIGAQHAAPVQPLPERVEGLRVRARRWLGILSAYFTTQTLTQLAGVLAGLVLVRSLPIHEFALYTLASSVITFFTFASDLGSTTSLVHFFHRSAKEGEDFRGYVAAVLSLRRAAFLCGIAAVAAVFPRAAAARGFGFLEIALAGLGIVLGVWFQIRASLNVLTLRLANSYGRSYKAELAGAGLRLLAALAMVVAGLLYGWLGLLATAAGTAVTAILARAPGGELAADPGPEAPRDLGPYRRRVLRYLLPTLPSALYFSVQGPLVVWLAATFGGTRNIAEVGALGRLGLVVGLFSGLSGVVFLPRLAQITDDRLYWARYLQFGSLLAALALGLLLVALLFPWGFLWLLGGAYSGLHRELLLVITGAGLMLLGGYAVSVNLARAWTRWQSAACLVLAAAQGLLAAWLPLSTTEGILTFNTLSAAVGLALQIAVTLTGLRRPGWVQWR